MNILFGGHEFHLLASGAMFWPLHDMVIVSDLHLEKGSHYARGGFYLPPYDSAETLAALSIVMKKTGAKKLLLLGDVFHDKEGYERLLPEQRALFDSLLQFDPVWVLGNHDKNFAPAGFGAFDVTAIDGISFRHEAGKGKHEISGHYHPKAYLPNASGKIACRCFVEDGEKLILPAFGAYTGGLCVEDEVFSEILSPVRNIYLLGERRVYLYQSKKRA